MNLDCIAGILIEAGLATALGVDIFEHHMPESCINGILLKLPAQGIPVNHYVPDFYRARFQAIYRNKDHATGDAMAINIANALTMTNQTFYDADGVTVLLRIMQCYPVNLPIVYPRSAGNVYEWAINLSSQYIMPNVLSQL